MSKKNKKRKNKRFDRSVSTMKSLTSVNPTNFQIEKEGYLEDFARDEKGLFESTKRTQKVLKFKGIFQTTDVENSNGRIYPRKVMEEAISEIYPKIKQRAVIGELDHFDGPPRLAYASHLILDLQLQPGTNKIIGEAVTLPTQFGAQLRGLLEAGVTVGVSLRGYGDTHNQFKEGKSIEVVDTCHIMTYDVVFDPSHPEATITQENIIYESSSGLMIVTRRNRYRDVEAVIQKLLSSSRR